jgi:hypothetical protein
MSIKHFSPFLFSLVFLFSCTSNPKVEEGAKDNSETISEEVEHSNCSETTKSNSKNSRFYFDYLALGFDLDSSWNRTNEEKEIAVKKVFYNLDDSKVAIDIVGLFENDEQHYLAISTSNMSQEWIFDEARANEYFMNKVNRRFEGEVNGVRYVAFNVRFDGGQWVRAFIHNAPLRNFELNLVSTNPNANLDDEMEEVISTIKY